MTIDESRFQWVPTMSRQTVYHVLGMIAFQYDFAPREAGFTAWFVCEDMDGGPCVMLRENYGWYEGGGSASTPPLSQCLGSARAARLTEEEAAACRARLSVTFDRTVAVPVAANLGLNIFRQEEFDHRP